MCVRKVGVWGAVSPSKCLRQRECAVSSPMGGYAAAGGGVWKAVQKPSSRQGPLWAEGHGAVNSHTGWYLLTLWGHFLTPQNSLCEYTHACQKYRLLETLRLVKVMRERFVSRRHTLWHLKVGRIFLHVIGFCCPVHNCSHIQLCPNMAAHTRPCLNMTVPEHDCTLTWLCPYMTVHKHDGAQTWWCPNMMVPERCPKHDCVQTRPCPYTTVPLHNCAWTQPCLNMTVPIQDCARTRLCPYMTVPEHDHVQTRQCFYMTMCLHNCAFTQLCPNMTVPKHNCAWRQLWPYTTVYEHDCAHTQLCPNMTVHERDHALTWPCPNTTVPIRDCEQTRLCLYTAVCKHDCERTRLCVNTTVPNHSWAQTWLCPITTVPVYNGFHRQLCVNCAQTQLCLNTTVPGTCWLVHVVDFLRASPQFTDGRTTGRTFPPHHETQPPSLGLCSVTTGKSFHLSWFLKSSNNWDCLREHRGSVQFSLEMLRESLVFRRNDLKLKWTRGLSGYGHPLRQQS